MKLRRGSSKGSSDLPAVHFGGADDVLRRCRTRRLTTSRACGHICVRGWRTRCSTCACAFLMRRLLPVGRLHVQGSRQTQDFRHERVCVYLSTAVRGLFDHKIHCDRRCMHKRRTSTLDESSKTLLRESHLCIVYIRYAELYEPELSIAEIRNHTTLRCLSIGAEADPCFRLIKCLVTLLTFPPQVPGVRHPGSIVDGDASKCEDSTRHLDTLSKCGQSHAEPSPPMAYVRKICIFTDRPCASSATPRSASGVMNSGFRFRRGRHKPRFTESPYSYPRSRLIMSPAWRVLIFIARTGTASGKASQCRRSGTALRVVNVWLQP